MSDFTEDVKEARKEREKETAVDTVNEYRNHYIRLRVHRFGSEMGSDKEATVSVHKNRPSTGPFNIQFLDLDRSALEEWTVDIPPRDSEDALTDALEGAKSFVDTRTADSYSARESAAIAVERAFSDEDEQDDGPTTLPVKGVKTDTDGE